MEVNATASYYENNEMQATGQLYYVGSESGYDPDDRLDDGAAHTIYLSSAAERALGKDPYLVNLTESTINGWIGDGYEVRMQLGGYLDVYQPYTSGNYTRDTWVQYEFVVDEIDTNMLYRPNRNDTYITILCAGGILIALYSVLKWVRND